MIKGKEILGRPIVSISTGDKVANVQDIVFDRQGNQVLAFLVDEAGWFRAAKAVPFERVRSIGEHAVMIGSADDVTTTRDDHRLADALEAKGTNLLGMTLLTTDGQNLGKIADVYFDEHSGAVVGYEATGGLFADMSSGRAFIPVPSDVQIGADAAIVPLSVAHAMKENPGGLRGAIKSVGSAVTGSVQSASDSVKEGVQSAQNSVKSTVQQAQSSVQGAVAGVRDAANERQQEFVVGKVSNTEIVADDGTVIIKNGEKITPLHAEVAEWHGKLPALVAAATGGTLAGAVTQATGTVKGAYEDAASATRARQKEFVVGKISGADILLDNGMAIVHKGDIITAAQAEAAETAGKLTALSAAVTGGELAHTAQDAAQGVRARVQESYADIRDTVNQPAAQHPVAGQTVVGQTVVGQTVVGQTVVGQTEGYGYEVHGGTPLTTDDTVGRRIKHDVRASGGSLLAVQGQIVTPELIARAQQLGLEQELIDATLGGSYSATTVTESAAEVLNSASAAVAGGVATVTEGASGLLSRAKTWLSEKRDETEAALSQREQEAREERLRDSLGRPVTRVILAPDDSIILNVGEVVTNKAIQAAQAGGVLDILLESVSHVAPTLDPLATRPDESGHAALSSQGTEATRQND